jgi:hypothetical protein
VSRAASRVKTAAIDAVAAVLGVTIVLGLALAMATTRG